MEKNTRVWLKSREPGNDPPDCEATNSRGDRVAIEVTEPVTIKDPDAHGEPRYVMLGMDGLGRRIRLISARGCSRSEAEQYHA